LNTNEHIKADRFRPKTAQLT